MKRAKVDYKKLPLVYSCSGCSSAAQMANALAVRLDREGRAEMSCIAGVGGDVPAFIKQAQSGRRIIAIDGCPIQCAKLCLQRHGAEPDSYWLLSDHGVKRHKHRPFDEAQAAELYERIIGASASPE